MRFFEKLKTKLSSSQKFSVQVPVICFVLFSFQMLIGSQVIASVPRSGEASFLTEQAGGVFLVPKKYEVDKKTRVSFRHSIPASQFLVDTGLVEPILFGFDQNEGGLIVKIKLADRQELSQGLVSYFFENPNAQVYFPVLESEIVSHLDESGEVRKNIEFEIKDGWIKSKARWVRLDYFLNSFIRTTEIAAAKDNPISPLSHNDRPRSGSPFEKSLSRIDSITPASAPSRKDVGQVAQFHKAASRSSFLAKFKGQLGNDFAQEKMQMGISIVSPNVNESFGASENKASVWYYDRFAFQ